MTDEQFETIVKQLKNIDQGINVVAILCGGIIVIGTIMFMGS